MEDHNGFSYTGDSYPARRGGGRGGVLGGGFAGRAAGRVALMADLNLVVLSGRLAVDPEVRQFESGSMMVRLLVTTRVESPRTRVDVIPVTYWPELADDPIVSELASATRGSRVWVCGAVQRRFWESPDGRRSRVEVVAESVSLRESEAVTV